MGVFIDTPWVCVITDITNTGYCVFLNSCVVIHDISLTQIRNTLYLSTLVYQMSTIADVVLSSIISTPYLLLWLPSSHDHYEIYQSVSYLYLHARDHTSLHVNTGH